MNKLLDSTADLVADRSYDVDYLAGGVVEGPIFVALTRVEGTGVAAAHRDHDVGGLHCFGSKDLGFLGGDVDSFLSHGLNGYGVDLVGWLAAGGSGIGRHQRLAVGGSIAEPGRMVRYQVRTSNETVARPAANPLE